jgi:hypothetical protein
MIRVAPTSSSIVEMSSTVISTAPRSPARRAAAVCSTSSFISSSFTGIVSA